MTDQTEGIVAMLEREELANAWGPKARQDMAAKKAQGQAEEARQAGEKEYRSSVLSQPGRGPTPKQYDYGALVTAGQSLADDDAGGVSLPNRYIKPGNVAVAGYDMGDGDDVLNDGLSDEGKAWVKNGLFGLRQSFTHTTDGAPIDVTGHIAKVAFAYAADGRSFEDYKAATGMYSDDLAHKAWAVAQKAQLRINYENLVTNQALLEMKAREELGEAIQVAPPDPEQTIPVEELPNNADWLLAARFTHELLEGRPFVGTPQELSNYAVEEMGYFFNSTIYMARAMAALHDATPQEAEAFLRLSDMFENRVEANFTTAANVAGAMASDLPSWMLGGVAGKASLSAARRIAAKNVMRFILAGAGAGATEGGLWASMEETAKQQASQQSGRQESIDEQAIVEEAALGAAAGAALGAGLPAAVTYGTRAAKSGGQMIRRWVNEGEMNALEREMLKANGT